MILLIMNRAILMGPAMKEGIKFKASIFEIKCLGFNLKFGLRTVVSFFLKTWGFSRIPSPIRKCWDGGLGLQPFCRSCGLWWCMCHKVTCSWKLMIRIFKRSQLPYFIAELWRVFFYFMLKNGIGIYLTNDIRWVPISFIKLTSYRNVMYAFHS